MTRGSSVKEYGDKIRVEARPLAGRAGARGPSGAACRLAEGVACNFKRMVHARLGEMVSTAQRAAGAVPGIAAA